MRAIFSLSNILSRIAILCGRVGAWAFFPLMLIIMLDVVMRRFFVVGSIRLQELEWHFHAILFLFCLGFAYLANAHVRIELISERLPDRARVLIELLGLAILMLPLCWILLSYSIDLVLRSYASGESSPHPGGLPYRWMIKAVMPVGFTLLIVSGVASLLRSIILLFGKPELREHVIARVAQEARKHGEE